MAHPHRRREGLAVTAAVESSPELLTLHAVRLKGMADDDEVAARFGLEPAVARESLLDFQAVGWVTRVDFAGTGGWTLTGAGSTENERQLAHELAVTDSREAIYGAYREFLLHNDRLLRASTDWQLRPSKADPLAVNDHTATEWDRRVLDELTVLSHDLGAVCLELSSQLARFAGYDHRFVTALTRAEQGEHSWVNRPRADSCHTVWMELHEDLLATLGIQRGSEPPA
jgi:hypothetical protein